MKKSLASSLILLTALIVAISVWLQFPSGQETLKAIKAVSLGDMVALSKIAQSVVTTLAVLGGAAWAYFNYFSGRTYRPRLEISIQGEAARHSDKESTVMKCTLQLKNLGLSKVTLNSDGTGVRLLSMIDRAIEDTDLFAMTADWQHLATFPLFEGHDWIEPSEVIQEQRLVELPRSSCRAYKIEVDVVAGRITWSDSAILLVKEELIMKGDGDERQDSRSTRI